MQIVIDNREQQPFTFADARYSGTNTTFGSLVTGDYSLVGLENRVAVERKSLVDLVQCLGRDRARFVRELERARALESFAVVVEASWGDLAHGQYGGNLQPHAACQSVMSFMARLNIPFMFAGTRAGAEYVVWSILKQFLQGKRHEMRAIELALAESSKNVA